MTDDTGLLQRYHERGDEAAFAELVQRNLDLVYAAALRHTGDRTRAADVTQAVFTDLARKAAALHRHPALVSWLYTSTRFCALKLLRTERRRQAREQEVFLMREDASSGPAPDWERLRPTLDAVLHELGERDREIVLLRYFRGLAFAEVAAALRINEGAARMRVERALEKMSRLLARRGIDSTAAALGVALAAQPALAAPAGLAATVTTAAFAGAAAGGTGAAAFATFLAMSKTPLIVAGVLVAALLATGVYEARANLALREKLAAANDDGLAGLRQQNQTLRASLAQLGAQNPELDQLNQARDRVALLKHRPEGVTDAGLHVPQNRGHATPADEIETALWAAIHSDFDTYTHLLTFSDDTPENRAAFMAQFSPAIRERYRTPEGIVAAGLHRVGDTRLPDNVAAIQVYEVVPDKVREQVKVRVWARMTSGRELGAEVPLALRSDGWADRPQSLTKPDTIAALQGRLDPATGDFVPPPPKTGAPRP